METSGTNRPISTSRTTNYGSTDQYQLENNSRTPLKGQNDNNEDEEDEKDQNILNVISPVIPIETHTIAAETRTTIEGYQTIEEEDYTSSTGENSHILRSARFARATTTTRRRRYTRMTAEKLDGGMEPVGFRKMQRFEQFINVLAQILTGFIVIYMCSFCISNGLSGTSLHAFLATLGFVFLMAEGMMSHYNNNVLTFTYKRTTKTTMHWMLEALGGLLGVSAVLLKYIGEGFYLESTHDKLGFSAFIFCLVSMLSGMSSLFSSKMKCLFSPLCNKMLHNLFGFVTYVLAMLTYYYGYQFGFFSHQVSTGFLTMMETITLLAMVLVAIGPIKSLYSKMVTGYRSID